MKIEEFFSVFSQLIVLSIVHQLVGAIYGMHCLSYF